MRLRLSRFLGGLCVLGVGALAAAASEPVFATPLPPGPGVLPLTVPQAPLAAPVLMPVNAPTAAATQQLAACGPDCSPRWYASADFLYGATQGVFVPPLVTAAPATVPLGQAGALFNPNTAFVFGNRRLGNDTRPGFKLNVGYWCDDARTRGVDAGFFFLGSDSETFASASAAGGNVILARPLVNGLTATNVGLPVAGPVAGGITASVDTSFIGADVNYRRLWSDNGCRRIDLIAGYRYLHLGDTADVWQTAGTPVGFLVLPAGTAVLHDSFRTRNAFHGPQVGLIADRQFLSGLHVELLLKFAMGVTVAEANADGTTTLVGGAAVPVGVLAGPTNATANTTGYFAVIPEAGLRLGYEVCEGVRVSAGYTFLYWSKVRRASEQIDLSVLAPGRPAFRNATTDVWFQGWTLGLEVRY